MNAIWQNLPALLVGLRLTVQYAIIAIILMVIIGLIAALMRLSKFAPLRWIAAALTLSLNEGAYVTEIIRVGILGIDRGQKEAAASVAMNNYQSMRHIILPQAFKRMIPPLVDQAAQTIKDTSLLAPVGIAELVYKDEIVIATISTPSSRHLARSSTRNSEPLTWGGPAIRSGSGAFSSGGFTLPPERHT